MSIGVLWDATSQNWKFNLLISKSKMYITGVEGLVSMMRYHALYNYTTV
jgi:hypothetical protein